MLSVSVSISPLIFLCMASRIRATQMGKAGAGGDAMCRVRMIERRQQGAVGKQLVVVVRHILQTLVDELGEAAAARNGRSPRL